MAEESAKQLVRNVLKGQLAEGLLSQLNTTDSFFQKSGQEPYEDPFVCSYCLCHPSGGNYFKSTKQNILFSTIHDLLAGENKHKSRGICEDHFRLSINPCGDLALEGVFDHKFDFQPEDFSSVKEQVLLAIVLMNKYTAQRLKLVS